MKFKPGDKVWVIRTNHPGAPVPPGAVRAGVVLSTWRMRPSGQTYMVDIPSVPHPRSHRTEWVVYEHRMRPRDEDDDTEPTDRFGDSTPNKVTVWGERGTWAPAEVKAEYLKWFTPMRR